MFLEVLWSYSISHAISGGQQTVMPRLDVSTWREMTTDRCLNRFLLYFSVSFGGGGRNCMNTYVNCTSLGYKFSFGASSYVSILLWKGIWMPLISKICPILVSLFRWGLFCKWLQMYAWNWKGWLWEVWI